MDDQLLLAHHTQARTSRDFLWDFHFCDEIAVVLGYQCMYFMFTPVLPKITVQPFSSFSVSLVTYMEMPPWTYTSAWHLWKLHGLMPSLISHLKASSVHLSHYLSSSKDSQLGKFISSGISLPFCISRSAQPENEPVPLTVPMRKGAVVLALAAGTTIHPRPQWSKPSKAETKCCAFRGQFHTQRQQDRLRVRFPLRSPNTRSKVSLRDRSTKPLPFTLDSSKVLWLAWLGSEQLLVSALRFAFPSCRHCPTISPAQVQQGRAEQTRALVLSNLSAAGRILLPVQRETSTLCSTSIKPK